MFNLILLGYALAINMPTTSINSLKVKLSTISKPVN